MKLSDGVIDCPLTGECTLHIAKLIRAWGSTTVIILNKTDDTYKLYSRGARLKVNISKNDARELIKLMDMVECPHSILNSSTFYSFGIVEDRES